MYRPARLPTLSVSFILFLLSFAGCYSASAKTTPVPIQTDTVTVTSVTLNISAGASWTDAIKEINNLYTKAHPWVTIVPNFAGMGTLQQQVENGAPCDVFMSGATSYMDNLQKGDLIITDTRINLLKNRVVLIVPGDSTLSLTSFSDLTLDKVKKIAIGDPKSVAVGLYAQQTFDLLGITAAIQSKLILGADTRQVLTYVETGNVDAGVVFFTDALTSSKVKIIATAPDKVNSGIVYPVAIIKACKNITTAKDYLNFMSSSEATAIFEKYGFILATT
jgi:molybdate transport system substrate-binding protein